ncbi:hypothetical protein LTR84_012146 [Exophiala bonariae]|uniref:Clr5 domain-containing protein n=1 Tax=Exophiala bonariae TaxID=1690606 RepID=A0AAV9NGD6_9EURO|nr:hypothetical protein LTR84_012146 [Exophiala bonariae]
MIKQPLVTSDSFITFNGPEEMTSAKVRSQTASYIGRYRRQKRTKDALVRRDGVIQGFLSWRHGTAPIIQHRQKQLTATTHDKARYDPQDVVTLRRVLNAVPASLNAGISLQQFFQGNPFFFFPGQVMLDAGSVSAAAFFSTISFGEVEHAVMGMFYSWLATQFPTQFQISAALHHRGKAISVVRHRLSQDLYDNETYLNILCTMQTEALLGDENALGYHQKGLEALSKSMAGKLNDYCNSVKSRHQYLVKKVEDSFLSTDNKIRDINPLRYLNLPYPKIIVNMLSMLPCGFQELAYQEHALSVEMIEHLARTIGWEMQVRFNSASVSGAGHLDLVSPLYATLIHLWRILEAMDSRSSPLERIFCIAHYLQMSSLYYRRIVLNSSVFQALRSEGTELAIEYQPQTEAERDNLIFHGILIISTWKTTSVLEYDGMRLFSSFKQRFPKVRQWDTLVSILQKFPWLPPLRAEWKDNLEQSNAYAAQYGEILP